MRPLLLLSLALVSMAALGRSRADELTWLTDLDEATIAAADSGRPLAIVFR